jgi:hypothetical protein
MYTNFNKK